VNVKWSASLVKAASFPLPCKKKKKKGGYPAFSKVRSISPWLTTKEELELNEFVSYFLIVQ